MTMNVSQIKLLNLNSHQAQINKQNYQSTNITIPGFSPKYSKNLSADTISFKGGPTVNIEKARTLIQQNSKRAGYFQDIGQVKLQEIISKLGVAPQSLQS